MQAVRFLKLHLACEISPRERSYIQVNRKILRVAVCVALCTESININMRWYGMYILSWQRATLVAMIPCPVLSSGGLPSSLPGELRAGKNERAAGVLKPAPCVAMMRALTETPEAAMQHQGCHTPHCSAVYLILEAAPPLRR